MVYDTDVHIPGQVDFFLMSFNQKNLDGINLSLETLLELVKDDGFREGIEGYGDDYKNEQKKIDVETLGKLKNVKSLEDGIRVITENKNQFDQLQYEYLSTIRTFIVTYFKKTGESVVNPGMNDSDVVDVEDEIDRRIRR